MFYGFYDMDLRDSDISHHACGLCCNFLAIQIFYLENALNWSLEDDADKQLMRKHRLLILIFN